LEDGVDTGHEARRDHPVSRSPAMLTSSSEAGGGLALTSRGALAGVGSCRVSLRHRRHRSHGKPHCANSSLTGCRPSSLLPQTYRKTASSFDPLNQPDNPRAEPPTETAYRLMDCL
jgi:hypothetical protein